MARKKAIKPKHALNQTRTNRKIKFNLAAAPSNNIIVIALVVILSLGLISSSTWLPSSDISVSYPKQECFSICDPAPDSSLISAQRLFLIHSVCNCKSPSISIQTGVDTLASGDDGYKSTATSVFTSISSTYYAISAGAPRPENLQSQLRSLFNNVTGGYSQHTGMVPTLTSTIHALLLLDSSVSDEDIAVSHSFIQSCVKPDGSFTERKHSAFAEPAIDSSILYLYYFDSLTASGSNQINLPAAGLTRSFVRFCILQLDISPEQTQSHFYSRGIDHYGSSLPSVALLRSVGVLLLIVAAPFLWFQSQFPKFSNATLIYIISICIATTVLWLPKFKGGAIVPLGAAVLFMFSKLVTSFSGISYENLEPTILMGLATAIVNVGAVVGLNILMPDVASLSNPGLIYLVILIHPFPYVLLHFAVGSLFSFKRPHIHRASALLSHLITIIALVFWFGSRNITTTALRILTVRGHAAVLTCTLPIFLLLASEASAMYGLSII